ncbi:hypothetical protein DPQ33_04470 [Oceanidesulfovibrio indonesiensis]|uniref:HTH HARE-type domain-containing protein n=1 Tax=Oceanidesulfovibrio indonesiensis TaxID=54767 RepID=A0A7M3MHQ8_9BACT|nr:HTH domain-containing protein [Oceanidesulfovibrio indonesiensis]TVM18733.1 hypothetical protein DPQ33_04470 [Oceanidesulfovibrio indonesiensis]
MHDMPWKEAILEVLSKSSDAMHYADIAEKIVELGLRKNKIGATPANTVNVYINGSINEEKEGSPFIRVSRGVYSLKGKESLAEVNAEQGENGQNIVNAFGMFWQRDFVLWCGTPKLLGRQQLGADSVDFSEQIGVYILYDGKETVYVGRAIDRPLGKRLYEHTQDRLNGRWNRFSWFGLYSVRALEEGGGVLEKDVANTSANSADMIVSTLESLLIEGLEPPQNRKRGDGFNASEYLQAIDPEIEKRRVKKTLNQLLEKYNTD